MSFDFNTFIAAVAGTGVFTFLFKIGEKIYDEHLLDKRNRKLSKSELADEVIKICSEAKSSDFKMSPRNFEHVVFIINKASVYDPNVGKMLDDLATTWSLIPKLSDGEDVLGIDKNTYAILIEKFQKQCVKLCKELLEKVKHWK